MEFELMCGLSAGYGLAIGRTVSSIAVGILEISRRLRVWWIWVRTLNLNILSAVCTGRVPCACAFAQADRRSDRYYNGYISAAGPQQ